MSRLLAITPALFAGLLSACVPTEDGDLTQALEPEPELEGADAALPLLHERPDAPLLSEGLAPDCPALATDQVDIISHAELGDTAELTVTITNACEAGLDLVVDHVAMVDHDASFELLTPVDDLALSAGESTTLRFSFTPSADFMHLADVTIFSNDPDVPEASLLLVGLVGNPDDLPDEGKSGAAPTADAGADQVVTTGDSHTLDGTGSSDPEGDTLTYRWSFLSVASGSSLANGDINNSLTDTADFTSDVDGQYRVRFVVSDSTSVDKDFVWVTATDGTHTAPTADSGVDQNVTTGGLVTLDATGSSDPEGDTLSYVWSFRSVPSGSALGNSDITDRTTDTATFTPDVDGNYRLRLVVNDGSFTDKDFMWAYSTTGTNNPPVADGGSHQTGVPNETFVMDASGSSDPDGDPITYSWSFQSVPAGSALANGDISGSSTASPSFTADAEGRFRMRLVVNDGSATDKVFVNVDTAYTYTYGTDVQDIYDNNCTAGCHSGGAPSAGLDLDVGASYTASVDVVSTQDASFDLVEPGDSANSYLWQKVDGSASAGQQMPSGGPFLDQADIDLIATWIDEGAPNN